MGVLCELIQIYVVPVSHQKRCLELLLELLWECHYPHHAKLG
jgi:hypothetical protein